MSIKIEKTDKKNELKLEFTIEAEKFDEAMKKVYFKSAKYFNIPGFRKGKAPMQIVEKYYGDEIFYEDEFKALGADVIIATADGSTGVKGFVTDAVNGLEYSYVYTCGPEPMLKAVYNTISTSG